MTLKERFQELQSDYLREIEKGNFHITDVEIRSDVFRFIIDVDGIKSDSFVTIEYRNFANYGATEPKIINSAPCPETLWEQLQKFDVKKRMDELMDEYNRLASAVGNPLDEREQFN